MKYKYIPKTFHDFDFNKHFGILNHDKTIVTYHLCNTLFCTHCHFILNSNYDTTISENVNSPETEVSAYKTTYKMIMAHHIGTMKCPNCSNASLVPIDSVIAPVIREFNERGWKTSECCSGHPYVDDDGKVYCSPTFIIFSIDQPPLTSLREEIDELVTANEKLSIPIDGFHIFLLRDKKPCTTEYKLCIYINNRLPETYISITHPSPVCNTVKFNDHVYSYSTVNTKWDRKSSYQKAVDTIASRCQDLLSIAINVSDRIHK